MIVRAIKKLELNFYYSSNRSQFIFKTRCTNKLIKHNILIISVIGGCDCKLLTLRKCCGQNLIKIKFPNTTLLLKIFFWCAPFGYLYFPYFLYVIASIAYNHPVYGGGVWAHDLLIMSPLPLPLDHGSCLKYNLTFKVGVNCM